ncbi:hypothetical protein DFH28DRAFT_1104119 [Melampsora americana]|nr:hypothetical protein DFH28DRAFT_1104119 [Melampsora americana]
MKAEKRIPERPSSAFPSLSLNKSNVEIDENEMMRIRNRLRNRFDDFQSNSIFLEENQKQNKLIHFNPTQSSSNHDEGRSEDLREFIKQNNQLRMTHSASVQPKASTSSDRDEVRNEALRGIIKRNQLRIAQSASAQPQASTSSIPYQSRPQAHNEMSPFMPHAGPSNLKGGGFHGHGSPSFGPSENKENGEIIRYTSELVQAIQRVILVSCDPSDICQGDDSNPSNMSQSIHRVIKNYLSVPSFYLPIPVLIKNSEITQGVDLLRGSKKFTIRTPLPPPGTVNFDVYYGPIKWLVIEGLRPHVLPYLIAYFNSPIRNPLSPQIKSTGVFFYIIDFDDQRHPFYI